MPISDQVLNDLVRDIKQAAQWKPSRSPDGKPFWRAVAEAAADMYAGGDPQEAFNCVVRSAVMRVWLRTAIRLRTDPEALDAAVANAAVRRAVLVMLRRRTDGLFMPDPALPVVINDAAAFARLFAI